MVRFLARERHPDWTRAPDCGVEDWQAAVMADVVGEFNEGGESVLSVGAENPVGVWVAWCGGVKRFC